MGNTIDDQLLEFEEKHKYNWQRLIYRLRRHMDLWNDKNVKGHFTGLKHSYLPVLFSIPLSGSTVTQVGQRSLVVKQNVSRTIKELEDRGMIVTHADEIDKRSERLDLTLAAKEIILKGHLEVEQLQNTYKELVGEKDWQIATDVLIKIVAYHESLNIKPKKDDSQT